MLQWLTKAGDFAVDHIGGIPHFAEPVLLDAPRAGVLHTTEGGFSMGVFKTHFAPHFVVGHDETQGGKVRIAQLVPIGGIGAALVTHNHLAIVQVEMVGFSKTTAWFPDDETAAALAGLMAACRDEYGIPLSHPWPDGDYGLAGNNPHRQSGKFGKIAGWFGHGDIELPDTHWDPGDFQWSRIFDLASKIAPQSPSVAPPEPPRPCAGITLAAASNALQGAVRVFQQAAGLVVDGDLGPITLTAYERGLR